jgi:hypothetical protein
MPMRVSRRVWPGRYRGSKFLLLAYHVNFHNSAQTLPWRRGIICGQRWVRHNGQNRRARGVGDRQCQA